MDENNLKCPNCGASISYEEKKCSYCGSPNKFYNKPKPKALGEEDAKNKGRDKKEEQDDDFGGLFGGFLGGIALSKAIKDITKSIFPHGKKD